MGPKSAAPALLIRASIRRGHATTAAIMPATVFESETSQTNGLAPSSPPAIASSSPASRSIIATCHPSAMNSLVVASPIPRAAPVTIAVFFIAFILSGKCLLLWRPAG